MLELFLDWDAAFRYGTDVVVYLVMAIIGTTFFVLRLVFALFIGGDGDFDTGVDADMASDHAFGVFSLLSVLAFFMGAGWMGLTYRVDWGMGSLGSAASSAGFGFGMMMLASGLMLLTRRPNQAIEYDLETAVGKTARVYMTIPPKGDSRGQVEVDVSGRRKVLEAVSKGDKLAEFSSVKILSVRDDSTLVVEPVS